MTEQLTKQLKFKPEGIELLSSSTFVAGKARYGDTLSGLV